jgi:hypothetical protein
MLKVRLFYPLLSLRPAITSLPSIKRRTYLRIRKLESLTTAR